MAPPKTVMAWLLSALALLPVSAVLSHHVPVLTAHEIYLGLLIVTTFLIVNAEHRRDHKALRNRFLWVASGLTFALVWSLALKPWLH